MNRPNEIFMVAQSMARMARGSFQGHPSPTVTIIGNLYFVEVGVTLYVRLMTKATKTS